MKNRKSKRLLIKSEREDNYGSSQDKTGFISNVLFFGLGVASLVGQAALERYLRKRLLGPVLGVWGPIFLLIGLYNRMNKIETEVRKNSLH